MARRPVTVLVYHPTEARAYAESIRAPRGSVVIRTAATREEAAAAIAEADVLYAWHFPVDLFPKAARLRWLQNMGAGVEAILAPTLPARVVVTRTPGIFGPWMVEYVLGWMLYVTQRMGPYGEARRERRWLTDLIPERLGGKTLLVVGLGDIGRAVARAAGRLGMRTAGVSLSGRPARGVGRVFRASRLLPALGIADFVVVTLPLTAATRGLMGRRQLAAMRPSAWLVNVARGPVVDEAALLEALHTKRIAGAILDVFAEEPLPPHHPLWRFDNVVITPHIAGPSTPGEIGAVFDANLARFLAGRRVRYVVDRARGY